ncbi:MAG: rubredoxin [Ornithinibacter sp.]
MVVLSWVPWIWRRVMDPRVLAHVGGDLSRVNRVGAGVAHGEPVEPAAADAVQPPSARLACPSCGWVYDEVRGAPDEGWPAGTPISTIDPDWARPDCGVRERRDFVPVVAGG